MRRLRTMGVLQKGLPYPATVLFSDLAEPDGHGGGPCEGCPSGEYCLSCRRWTRGLGFVVSTKIANHPHVCPGYLPCLTAGGWDRLWYARPRPGAAASSDDYKFEDPDQWDVFQIHPRDLYFLHTYEERADEDDGMGGTRPARNDPFEVFSRAFRNSAKDVGRVIANSVAPGHALHWPPRGSTSPTWTPPPCPGRQGTIPTAPTASPRARCGAPTEAPQERACDAWRPPSFP